MKQKVKSANVFDNWSKHVLDWFICSRWLSENACWTWCTWYACNTTWQVPKRSARPFEMATRKWRNNLKCCNRNRTGEDAGQKKQVNGLSDSCVTFAHDCDSQGDSSKMVDTTKKISCRSEKKVWVKVIGAANGSRSRSIVFAIVPVHRQQIPIYRNIQRATVRTRKRRRTAIKTNRLIDEAPVFQCTRLEASR